MYTCVVSSVTGESSWSGALTVRGTRTETLHLLLFLSHFTLCHSHTSVVTKPHSLPLFSITAPSVAVTRMKVGPASLCFCRRRDSLRIQSFWVHPASRTSAEARGDWRDQKHRHSHLAVQSTWRGGCCHILHYWGLQVLHPHRQSDSVYLWPLGF